MRNRRFVDIIDSKKEREFPEMVAIVFDGKQYTSEMPHPCLLREIIECLHGVGPDEAEEIIDAKWNQIQPLMQEGFTTTKNRFVDRKEAFLLLPPKLQIGVFKKNQGRWLDSSDLDSLWDYNQSSAPKPKKDTSLHPFYRGKLGD